MEKCHCGNTKFVNYSDNYYACEACKTLVSKHSFNENICHVEDESTDLYGENYWKKVMLEEVGLSSINELIDFYLQERVIYWIKHLLKYIPFRSSLAEVGCGLGQLAYVLQMLEYSPTAFELSPAVCKYVKEELKINIVCSEMGKYEAKYDAILAFDVFEHLLEPESFLADCSTHLKDKGIICMQTPCYDSDLSYEQMCERKPRFKDLMVEEQHIYLYSREAITKLLNKYGFNYVVFEPAFFGDDYDMFLFASKEPIKENTKKEIDDYLNSVSAGRLVKAMITLFDANRELAEKYQKADNDRINRQEQIDKLGEMLKESEADRAARQEQIDKLGEMLKESEADRTARQEQIDKLDEMLKESETDRAARQEQIDKLGEMLKESETDRLARKEQIDKLGEMLKESETDRAARMEQIVELTNMINEIRQSEE